MALEFPVFCLFCRKPLEPGELAVFRNGAKIAHVRCWQPEDPSEPSRIGQSDRPELTSTPQS